MLMRHDEFCSPECELDYLEVSGMGVRGTSVRLWGERVSWIDWCRHVGQCPYCMRPLRPAPMRQPKPRGAGAWLPAM